MHIGMSVPAPGSVPGNAPSATPAMSLPPAPVFLPSGQTSTVDVSCLHSQAPPPAQPQALLPMSKPLLHAAAAAGPLNHWPALPDSAFSPPVLVDNSPATSTSASSPDVVSTASTQSTSPLSRDALAFHLGVPPDAVSLAEQALGYVEDLTQKVSSPTDIDGFHDTMLHQRVQSLSSRLWVNSQKLKLLKENGVNPTNPSAPAGHQGLPMPPGHSSSPTVPGPGTIKSVPSSPPNSLIALRGAFNGRSEPDESLSPRSRPSVQELSASTASTIGIPPAHEGLVANGMDFAHQHDLVDSPHANTQRTSLLRSNNSSNTNNNNNSSSSSSNISNSNSNSNSSSSHNNSSSSNTNNNGASWPASVAGQLGQPPQVNDYFVGDGSTSDFALCAPSMAPVTMTPSTAEGGGPAPHFAGTVDMWPVLSNPGVTAVRLPDHGGIAPGSNPDMWDTRMRTASHSAAPPPTALLNTSTPIGPTDMAVSSVTAPPPPPSSTNRGGLYYSASSEPLLSNKRPLSSDGFVSLNKRNRLHGPSDIRSMSTSDASSIMLTNPYMVHYPAASAYDPNDPTTFPPDLLNEEGLMTYIPETDKRFRNRKLLLALRPHLYHYLGVLEFRQLKEEQPSGQWVERMVPTSHSRGNQPAPQELRSVFNLDFQGRNFYKTNASLMDKMMDLGMDLAQRHPEIYGVAPGVLRREHIEHVCKDLLDSARSGFRLAIRLRSQKNGPGSGLAKPSFSPTQPSHEEQQP